MGIVEINGTVVLLNPINGIIAKFNYYSRCRRINENKLFS